MVLDTLTRIGTAAPAPTTDDFVSSAYDEHAGSVLALALRITRNRSLAEEVVQEVFVRLWRKPTRYDPARGSLRSFLLSDTHGRAVDLIRSEASRRTREENESSKVPAHPVSVEEQVMSNDTAHKVRSAVAGLPDAERDAIELAYFGGHTYREVAAILDQPEGTVKSRIRQGMKRLGSDLTDRGLVTA